MRGLKTARAVIVDDDDDDVLGLLKAFSRTGIGSIVYRGQIEELPDEEDRLEGIRLIALDMHLDTSELNEERIIDVPLKYLDSILSRDNGPYLVIAWTSKPELVDNFREKVKVIGTPPIGVIALDKSTVKFGGNYEPELIWTEVEKAIRESDPLLFLVMWEQLVHDSATATVHLLADSGGDWMATTKLRLTRLMTLSSPDLKDVIVSFQSILEGLNPLQLDALQAMAAVAASTTGTDHAALVGELCNPKSGFQPIDFDGDLNRRLLVAPPEAGSSPAPGAVFLTQDPADGPHPLFAELVPGTEQLLNIARSAARLKISKEGPEIIPLVLEITPLCDFQQGKAANARFLPGLAIPVSRLVDDDANTRSEQCARLIDSGTGPLRGVPPIRFESAGHGPLEGQYIFSWNARYLFTVPRAKIAGSGSVSVLRLRQPLLLDLQAWAAGHAARPGYLSAR